MNEAHRVLITVFLPPLITAGLAAFGIWLSERRKDHDASQHMRNAILEEIDHIAYLKLWIEIELLVGHGDGVDMADAREVVRIQLAQSRARLARAESDPVQDDTPSAIIRVAKTVVLVPLTRPAARIVRLGYWLVLVFGISCGILFVLVSLDPNNGIDPANALSPGTAFVVSFIVTMPFLIVSVLLAYWARALELRHSRNISATSSGASYPVMPSRPTHAQGGAVPGLNTHSLAPDYDRPNNPPWT